MTIKLSRGLGAAASAGAIAIAVSVNVSAAEVGARELASLPFDTGRFLTDGGAVYAGVFGSHVVIDSITIGEATFRARLDEFIEVASVRVYVDRDGLEPMQRLSDAEIAAGRQAVTVSMARDIERSRFRTTLDAIQGLDLGRMIHADGSARVRVDLLLSAAARDNRPGENDFVPEAMLVGNFGRADRPRVRIAAIIGGNVDDPILAGEAHPLDPTGLRAGRTGISMITDRGDSPMPISIIGVDLFALGVRDEHEVIGYRVEIEPGDPVLFNIFGAGVGLGGAMATAMPMLSEPEDFLDLELSETSGWDVIHDLGRVAMVSGLPGGAAHFFGGGGFAGGGGGGSAGRGQLGLAPGGDNGNGNGDGNGGENGNGKDDPPPIPGPGTLALMALSSIFARRRRGRETE